MLLVKCQKNLQIKQLLIMGHFNIILIAQHPMEYSDLKKSNFFCSLSYPLYRDTTETDIDERRRC